MESQFYGNSTLNLPLNGLDITKHMDLVTGLATTWMWAITYRTERFLRIAIPDGGFIAAWMDVYYDANAATITTTASNEYYQENHLPEKANAALKSKIDALIAQELKKPKISPTGALELWGALVPSKTYIITPALLYLCLGIYIAMIISGVAPLSPTPTSLVHWGGNIKWLTQNGAYWRLISYQFLHSGLFHLLMNGWSLLYIGMYLEPLIGKKRFLSAYLASGIWAGLASIWMHNNSVGVGASGAIFGLYGVFFALLTTNYIQQSLRRTLLRSILFFIVLNLINGLQDNIDNAAHVGGLLSGLIIGYIMYPGIKENGTQLRAGAISIIIILGSILLAISMLRFI